MRRNTQSRGFTLIELLVALAITGILATIALPNYGKFVARGKLTAAQSDLVALSLRLENRYQRVLSYPATAYSSTSLLQTELTGWVPASESDEFNFITSNASLTSYTITAVGLKGDLAECKINLTHDGVKSITDCTEYSANGEWL